MPYGCFPCYNSKHHKQRKLVKRPLAVQEEGMGSRKHAGHEGLLTTSVCSLCPAGPALSPSCVRGCWFLRSFYGTCRDRLMREGRRREAGASAVRTAFPQPPPRAAAPFSFQEAAGLGLSAAPAAARGRHSAAEGQLRERRRGGPGSAGLRAG